MNRSHVFLIRAVLGAAFAVLLTRFFFSETNITNVTLLAVFLVGASYLSEYLRKRKQKRAEKE